MSKNRKKTETLEEAQALIDELYEKVDKVIDEKKEVLKMFDDKDLEGMTETERKLAETLEAERAERAKLQKQIEDGEKARQEAEQSRITKLFDERITKVAKGDKDFETKLRTNIDLLEKMPRSTDTEIDAIIDSAYKLTGQKEPNPLNNGGHPSNNVDINGKTGFADTTAGKVLASRLGLQVEAPKDNGGAGGGQGQGQGGAGGGTQ